MNNPINSSYYVGHTIDISIRHQASSGGIGSSIQKYLLDSKKFGTTITFVFNTENCMYEPKLIYSSDEINICGSIYQDINIYHFLQENINDIKGGIIVSCPPCQVTPIIQLLNKTNIKYFIISFCCSGQTTIDGTWKYYQLQGIRKSDVVKIQYRGNGWPSGIQITTKDGFKHKWDNWTEPWRTIHRSGFFRPRRCFFCTYDTSYKSDVSLADPWLPNYLANDREGNTIIVVNTINGEQVLNELKDNKIINIEPTTYTIYETAQKNNLNKRKIVLSQQNYLKICFSFTRNKFYRMIFSQNKYTMRMHIKLMQVIFYFSSKANFQNLIINILNRIRRI